MQKNNSGWKMLLGTVVAIAIAAMTFVLLSGNNFLPESPNSTIQTSATTEAHTHIWGDWTVLKVPDCSNTGEEMRTCLCGEIETKTIPTSHTIVIDKGFAATCTETGLSDGSHCGECGEIIAKQTTLPIKHTVAITKGYSATCTEPGLSDGSYCSICGKILSSQETTPAKGHSAITDKGYTATCTKTGLSDGSHCGICGEILIAQEIIPITHTICTKSGDTTCETIEYCTLCGLEQESSYNHNYREATCTTSKICLNCGKNEGNPLPHEYSAATCTDQQTCKNCKFTAGEPLGHFYEDNKCIRCGEADPDCLFENLHVIDSSGYKGPTSKFTSSYGDNYNMAFEYYSSIDGSLVSKSANIRSIHNLKKSYKKLSGAFVAGNDLDISLSIKIYVDDKLEFSLENYNKTTGKIEFSVDVTNASTVKIHITSGSVRHTVAHAHMALVDVKLTK